MTRKGVPHINDPGYDVVWGACAELGVPVCFHAGIVPSMELEPYKGYSPAIAAAFRAMTRPASSTGMLSNFVISKIFERFPKLKVVFAESAMGLTAFSAPLIKRWPSEALLNAMERAKLPCGPINTIDQILADPHVLSRDLVHTLYRDDGTAVRVIGYPHRLSRTPTTYRSAPPCLAQDTRRVLAKLLDLDEVSLDALEANGTIANAVRSSQVID
jgi:hypothetical protein